MTIAVVCHPLSVALHCVASLHFSQYDHQQRWRRQRRRRLPRSSQHPNLYIITAPGRGKLPIKTYSIFFIFRSLLLCLPGTLNKSLSVALLCDDCVVGVGDDDYEQTAFIIIGMRHVFWLLRLNLWKLHSSAFLFIWDPFQGLIVVLKLQK